MMGYTEAWSVTMFMARLFVVEEILVLMEIEDIVKEIAYLWKEPVGTILLLKLCLLD